MKHPLREQIAQRLYGLVQGYEDLNDHEQLRHDPMFGIAIGKLESAYPGSAALAGKKHTQSTGTSLSCQSRPFRRTLHQDDVGAEIG